MITNTEGKILFFIEYDAGYCGTSEYERGFFEDEDEAWKEYEVTAREHRNNYDFDDEDDEFEDEISLSVVLYDPEEHDDYFDDEYVFMEGVSKYKIFEKDIKVYEEATGKTLDMSIFDTTIDKMLYILYIPRKDDVYFRAYNKTHAIIKSFIIAKELDIKIDFDIDCVWEMEETFKEDGYDYLVDPENEFQEYSLYCYSKEYENKMIKDAEEDINKIKSFISDIRNAEV